MNISNYYCKKQDLEEYTSSKKCDDVEMQMPETAPARVCPSSLYEEAPSRLRQPELPEEACRIPSLPSRKDADKKVRAQIFGDRLPSPPKEQGEKIKSCPEKKNDLFLPPPSVRKRDVDDEKVRAQVFGDGLPLPPEERHGDKYAATDSPLDSALGTNAANSTENSFNYPSPMTARGTAPCQNIVNVQPGAFREGGNLGHEDEDTIWTTTADEEVASPSPPSLDKSPEITTAELVTEKDVVPAVPTLPLYRQRKFQCLFLIVVFVVTGLTVGLVIPLMSKPGSTTVTNSTIGMPENDLCINAIGDLPVPSSTNGSNIGATGDIVDKCGSARGGETLGVWYTVFGTGMPISLSTCNKETASFDTEISVFAGGCGSLECIAGKDGACGVQNRVSWDSVLGEQYYVLVHGRGSTGEFQLDIEKGIEQDFCQRASGPLAIPSSTEGSTNTATVDNVTACGSASGGEAPGVWYTVIGTGKPIIASTCNHKTATFDTQLSVFIGECTSLMCLDGNDNACNLQSRVSWISDLGERYFILVHGRGATGNFQLRVEQDNDLCGGAVGPLPVPSSTEGSTSLATIDNVTACGNTWRDPDPAPGVWYSIVGTGNILSVSTCNDGTGYYTQQLTVFTGECSNLECIGGITGCGSPKGGFIWTSNAGTVYFVLVHGLEGENSMFQLDVEDLGAPLKNDVCEGAIGPLSIPSSTEGSTIGSNIVFVEDCGDADSGESAGVWFSVEGSGNVLSASTCNSETTFDTQISVFTGNCNSLECVGGDNDCGVEWSSNAGTVYFILVHGLYGETGSFQLDVEDLGPPLESDFCDGAIGPLLIPSSTGGSTIGFTIDDVPDCGGGGSWAPGVWYSVIGTGNVLSASTCNSVTTFDTEIVVFAGSCSSLKCVGRDDDRSCSPQSRVGWPSKAGTSYYILVHGFTNKTGDFLLDVEDLGPPLENDACDGAIGPLSIPSSTEGSTIGSIIDIVEDCGDVWRRGSGPGVWFTVVGNDNVLSVSTCNSETTFKTQISVFSGNCAGLECIVGNIMSCDVESRLSWASTAGVVYYILIDGYGYGETGDFQLDVEDQGPLTDNGSCEGAIGPLMVPSSTEGSTIGASIDNVEHCGGWGDYAPGVWYTLLGTGHAILLSTCNLETNFEASISVFSDSCGSLQCIEGNDYFFYDDGGIYCGDGDNRRVLWTFDSGVLYHVLVHGYSGETGAFTLDLLPVPDNNACEGALGPLSIPSSTEGSTINATVDDVDTCEFAYGGIAPGVWYSLLGTGNTIVASTCNAATDFDTQLSVFSGDCANLWHLECIAASDNACGSKSRVSWVSLSGVKYLVLVHGFEDTGTFILDISEAD